MIVSSPPKRFSRRALIIVAALAGGLALMMPAEFVHIGMALA